MKLFTLDHSFCVQLQARTTIYLSIWLKHSETDPTRLGWSSLLVLTVVRPLNYFNEHITLQAHMVLSANTEIAAITWLTNITEGQLKYVGIAILY